MQTKQEILDAVNALPLTEAEEFIDSLIIVLKDRLAMDDIANGRTYTTEQLRAEFSEY